MKLEEEKGFRSSFNFVPERYKVSPELRDYLVKKGFEVGVHGLKHGKGNGPLLERKKWSSPTLTNSVLWCINIHIRRLI
jgi:predicted deacetylase